MRINQRELTAHIPALTAQRLGTWRHNGFLNGVGKQPHVQRWDYRPIEALALWLADRLRRGRICEREAVSIAFAHATVVAMHVARRPAPYRYVTIQHGDGEGATVPAQSLAEIEGDDFESCDVFDLRAVAEYATPQVQEWAKAALS